MNEDDIRLVEKVVEILMDCCQKCGRKVKDDDLTIRVIHPWGLIHETCPTD